MSEILEHHFRCLEETLASNYRTARALSHKGNIGSVREHFISDFLQCHLSQSLALGTGEVIGAKTRIRAKRPQLDVVVYRRHFPKVTVSRLIDCFLVESVVATIEVKSKLTKDELGKSLLAAKDVKEVEPNWKPGETEREKYLLQRPLCYVVAYQGPKRMDQVQAWLEELWRKSDLEPTVLQDQYGEYRRTSALDGIFILGRGFIKFAGFPLRFKSGDDDAHWQVITCDSGALMSLFFCLTLAGSLWSPWNWFETEPYMRALPLNGKSSRYP